MLKKYSKNLSVLLIAIALFAFSALVVSACTPTPTPTTVVTPTPTPVTCPTTYTCAQCSDYPNHGAMCSHSMYNYCDDNYRCGYRDDQWKCNCEVTPTPTIDPCANGACVTPVPTTPPSTNSGGPGDGRSDNLGCGSHDCSGNQVGGGSQAVLGASTGPRVLGLSTTSGDTNSLLAFGQLSLAFILSLAGFSLFRKNAR